MADLASVSARNAAPILMGLRDAGFDPGPVLAEAGLAPSQLVDPDHRVEHDRVVTMWQRAEQLTADPDFGLRCAGLLAPGHLGVIEYAFRKSDCLRQGFERVQRYFRINHDVATFQLISEQGVYRIEHVLPAGRTLPRSAVDFILANPVRIARLSTEPALSPGKVLFDYARPADTAALTAWFQADLQFGAGARGFEYPLDQIEAPLLEADRALSEVLDQHADNMLGKIATVRCLGDRVRSLMEPQLCGGTADAQFTAAKLGISVRTLHRRLAEEGTSHKALLEQLRRDLSERCLREATMSISEAAFMVGFSEPSAFHRAFKRWNGCTPAQFRARHLGR